MVARTRSDSLLLAEWACLGILATAPAHGYDVASRLAADGDVGRIYTVSRPLTYRALDQLLRRGLIAAVGRERGRAGGDRTIFAPTRSGRGRLRGWLGAPVPHVRDIRTELLLKLLLCDLGGVGTGELLARQRREFEPVVDALALVGGPRRPAADPVAVWRYESSRAALRFIDRLSRSRSPSSPARR